MATTSWVQTKSQAQLRGQLQSYTDKQFKGKFNDKDLLTRRLKFVRPENERNALPPTEFMKTSTSWSTDSSDVSDVSKQHSDFKYASTQLFPESSIPGLMNWRSKNNTVGSGLRNLGNSCFMNATLQCMCYTAPFQNYIASKRHRDRCNTSGYCIFCELQKLMPLMLMNRNTTVPTEVFRNLRLLSKKLRPGRQEDAQEFLRFLMEGLQNNTLKEYPKKQEMKNMRVQETSVVHKIWGGYLRSQIKCTKCKYESNTYDSILDISLEIRGPSVRSALSHFTDPEILDEDNMYNCSKCKKKRRAIKQFTIFEPPNVLCIHLKRFSVGGGGMYSGGKISKHVKFEETLDLTDFMSYRTCPKVSYSLFGVLVHYGYSMQGGHYVSYIKAPDNQWYLMDDSRVERIHSINHVLKEKAYLLFYQRNEDKVLYHSPGTSPTATSKRANNASSSRSSRLRDRGESSSISSAFDGLKDLAKVLPKSSSSRRSPPPSSKRESASLKPVMTYGKHSNRNHHRSDRTTTTSARSTDRDHRNTTTISSRSSNRNKPVESRYKTSTKNSNRKHHSNSSLNPIVSQSSLDSIRSSSGSISNHHHNSSNHNTKYGANNKYNSNYKYDTTSQYVSDRHNRPSISPPLYESTLSSKPKANPSSSAQDIYSKYLSSYKSSYRTPKASTSSSSSQVMFPNHPARKSSRSSSSNYGITSSKPKYPTSPVTTKYGDYKSSYDSTYNPYLPRKSGNEVSSTNSRPKLTTAKKKKKIPYNYDPYGRYKNSSSTTRATTGYNSTFYAPNYNATALSPNNKNTSSKRMSASSRRANSSQYRSYY